MRISARKKLVVVLLLSLLTALSGAVIFACAEAPTSVPVRTFERAQRMDVVCLKVFERTDQGLVAVAPQGLAQEQCAPVPPDVNGGFLENQLFALVTQTSRGELAVVDLSAGFVVDQNRGVPGINFVPVGAVPTDVAVAPDGKMAFVASAEPNKAAIYGVPTRRILGDVRPTDEGTPTLASWPVCSLPQNPGALSIVPRRPGGADGGQVGPGAGEPTYDVVAMLPGDRRSSAKVVLIDPRPFLVGAKELPPDGVEELAPGSLAPCKITAAIEVAGSEAVPASFAPGAAWDDGVKYVDGGVDLSCDSPPRATACGATCGCGDAGPCAADAGTQTAIALGPLDAPRLLEVARDDQTLFIADDNVPLIHVVDLSTPGAPRELPPFVATSSREPSRAVAIRSIAVSPPTREFRRFLYAVDRKEGSILVYDVTDVRTASRTPMTRPHPELNPFQPPDRIVFGAPVVSVAFARHDFPLSRVGNAVFSNAKSGLLCNPNPNATTENRKDDGVFYRANAGFEPALGPTRLRGVFALATLSNGQILFIDVDDWDAPCRRPTDLVAASGAGTLTIPSSSLAVPPPAPTDANDIDPYHVPVALPETVTNESFFPVSSPHRLRSLSFLRDDPRTGRHIPNLTGTPGIDARGAPLALFGPRSDETPRMHPTLIGPGNAAGTDAIGIRFSFETPDVHIDQDWTVAYEGALLGFDGISATLSTKDDYSSIEMTQPNARFCEKGVEDWSIGGDRANQIAAALQQAGRPAYPERIDRRLVDYVQLTDDILPAEDPYWSLEDDPSSPCWTNVPPAARHDTCVSSFGATATNVEPSPARDFPILEAYDDHLVLGRFATLPPNQTREIVYKDPSNESTLKLMRCCFHRQARFRVRAASQWVTVGNIVGFLHHTERAPADGRCTLSCDPQKQLLNARAPSLPFGAGVLAVPDRNSPLAMRSPAFSFYIQNGSTAGVDRIPLRDTTWRFTTRGQFQALLVNLSATTTSVNPQSMRFIETLGQVAIVDAASQGLVLIDLGGVTVARAPYF